MYKLATYIVGTGGLQFKENRKEPVCSDRGGQSIRKVDDNELCSVHVVLATESKQCDGRHEASHQRDSHREH